MTFPQVLYPINIRYCVIIQFADFSNIRSRPPNSSKVSQVRFYTAVVLTQAHPIKILLKVTVHLHKIYITIEKLTFGVNNCLATIKC